MLPAAVVLPRSMEDVQTVMRAAGRLGVPVLPRGGGTSLAGSTVSHGIVLDFSRFMNQVLEVQPEEGWARVQPGLVVNQLNRATAQHGLHYAPDPVTSNRATIGGGIGTNSCGAHSVLYGKTLDHVRSVAAVLADGSHAVLGPVSKGGSGAESESRLALEVRRIALAYRDEVERRFPKIMRRVSGYNLDEFAGDNPANLSRIVVGSEGTLVVVTEATVGLVPLPVKKGLAAVHFAGLVEAMEATVAILEHGPSAVEVVGRTIIDRCRDNPSFRHLLDYVEGEPECLLLVEFYGETEREVEAKLDGLRRNLVHRGLGYVTVTATDPVRQRHMWALREAGLGLVMSVRGDTKPVAFVEDTAVSPELLPQYVSRFMEIVGRNGTEAAYYGHASTGCMHIRPMVNVKSREGLVAMERIANEVSDLVLEFAGSLSGEHGDGIVRGAFTEKMFGPELYAAFRELKQAFDPDALLNPGKIIDTPAMTEHLRLSPETQYVVTPTYLEFGAEGGLAGAVELCNGQGVCLKMEGTMCPSFMVTGEEEHSTRGRANLLRAVLAGKLPAASVADERLRQAMDLCVECKGCKAECPSGVDMAKLKAEVLTKYHDAHGASVRTRLFAHIALVGRLGSATAPVSNWIGRVRPFRWLAHWLLGIHHRRALPAFARTRFSVWFGRHQAGQAHDAPRGEVVLFNDTHMEYFSPNIGQAATRVLEALGYQVSLVTKKRCCGRPLISKGMLGKARMWARENVDALLPFASRGVPIVGTEPSCLLTFRDEYPDLLRDKASRIVASQAVLLEEFVARLAADDPETASVFRDDLSARVLVHGHCHEKALAGMEPALSALRLVPGYEPELVDAGCCGMAGAFGFEAEHHELSKDMGALRLFPALEAPESDGKLVAVTGISCHQQINQFTSRTPRHLAELLADALKEEE
jgi:FAD/FMN-containing dehydrogenase/Fe-S oxidoreductase